LLIIVIWFKILIMSWIKPDTIEFCTWLGFIVIWIYFSLQALVWPKVLLCPFSEKYREKMGCKS